MEIDPAQLCEGAVIAVVHNGTELAIADPHADGAFALQLDQPVKPMLQMVRRAGRRHNIKIWRCYGVASGRPAAVSIDQAATAVWAADSLHDWPVAALIGSPA